MQVERIVDFGENRSSVAVRDFMGDIQYASSWDDVTTGVRCRTWKFYEVDESLCDGALVEIQPGARTPVQYVQSPHVFFEVPLKGKLTFFSVNAAGEFSMQEFDSETDDASFMMEVKQGEIMCWSASAQQTGPAEVLEYEEPGFKSAALPTVEHRSAEIDGHKIPEAFWEAIDAFDSLQKRQTANSIS